MRMTMKNNNKKKHDVQAEEPLNEQVAQEAAETTEEAAEQAPEQESEGADAVKQAEERAAAAEDKYLRLAAEFDNFRRRTAKEKLDLVKSAGEDILKGILPVLDDCERAIEQLEKTEASTFEKEGTGLIYNKLRSYVKSCGLEEMEVKGKEFDTDTAEAVAQLPAPEPELKGKVIEVVQKGYTLNGKVVRFAKVVIGL
ncbi:MAG: nucleotide exchange factor GrpE [Bacteroidales bacterium]|nr:nucleotide exchange factor GrpE [Bacteroidales bacterium]